MTDILVTFDEGLPITDRTALKTSIWEIRYHYTPPDIVGQYEELLIFIIPKAQYFLWQTTSSTTIQITPAEAAHWQATHNPYWIEYLTYEEIVAQK